MDKLPVKLEQDTIVNAIFEVRFTSRTELVSNILLGMLFKEYGAEFPKIEKTNLSEIPQQILETDPRLRYAHYYKLHGEQYSLMVGEHVFSLSCNRPYEGWLAFREKILQLLFFVNGTGVIDAVQRFSLKYSNIVSVDDDTTLEKFLVGVTVGDFEVQNQPIVLHTEIKYDDYINIIDIKTNIIASIKGEGEFKGVVFDVDTIHKGGYKDFWQEIDDLLEEAHMVEKKVYFGLLKPETIDRLGPTWE